MKLGFEATQIDKGEQIDTHCKFYHTSEIDIQPEINSTMILSELTEPKKTEKCMREL